MFRFAHLVFGKGDESNENQENQENQENDEMIQKCVDDDWILIDVEKDGQKENKIQPNEKASSLIVPNTASAQCQQVDQTEPSFSSTEPSLGPTESSFSPTPVQTGHIMEESWFITPPPCFINHSNQINIETTPFENLLIEHPSMSVFGPSLPRTTSLSSLPSSLSSHASESSSATSSSATSSSNSVVTSQVYNNQQHQVQQTRPSRQQQQQQQQQQRVQRPHNGNGNFASRAGI